MSIENMIQRTEQTEKENFEAMLRRAQIPFTEEPSDRAMTPPTEKQIRITVPWKTLSQLEGYNDFLTKFHFDASGRLLTVGIWE